MTLFHKGLDSRIPLILLLGALIIPGKLISKWTGLPLLSSIFFGMAFISLLTFIYFLFSKKRKLSRQEVSGPHITFGEFVDSKTLESIQLFKLGFHEFRHFLITGITGIGKSTLLRRIMDEISFYESGFIYVDYKGEKRELDEIYAILKRHGREKDLQIFDLSDLKTCATINLFKLFPEIEETVGFINEIFGLEHEYYRSEAEQFLRYSLYLFDAVGMDRNFVNIRRLLRNKSFRARLFIKAGEFKQEPFYEYFEELFSNVSDSNRAERFSGFLAKLSTFSEGPLERIFNPEGDGDLKLQELFDKNIPFIIRIPGEAYGDVSTRIVKSFIASLPILIAKRRQSQKPKKYFIFLDEQCSYTSHTITHLLKTAGSAAVSIILTRQCDGDFDAMGPGFKSQVISACSVSFNFQTLDPETRDQLSKQSGTVADIKSTDRVSGGLQTGESSTREVQRFRISPNDFLELKNGYCIVSARVKNQSFDRLLRVYRPELERDAA